MSHGLVMEDTIIKDSQAMETKIINNAKEFIALIISPLPAPLVYYMIIVWFQKSGGDFSLEYILMIYLIGLPISYLTMIVIGIPMYLFIKILNLKSIIWYLIGGGISGFLVWLFISMLVNWGYYSSTFIPLFIAAIISSTVFFFVRREKTTDA